jgi:hypothetical protein
LGEQVVVVHFDDGARSTFASFAEAQATLDDVVGRVLFNDGFESGNTSAWSTR